jgi:hypothetical protein
MRRGRFKFRIGRGATVFATIYLVTQFVPMAFYYVV